MPRSRPATGEKAAPTSALTAAASTSPTTGGRPAPLTVVVDSPVDQEEMDAPLPARAACPRDSWPATPTSRVSPTAPMAVAITNRPVCSQKSDSTRGSASATRTSATPPIRLGRREEGSSDTDGLLAAQQARGPHEQD